jgi:hypothetical protein
MILQLDPAIPLSTPKGVGIAHLIIDYGIENDLYWVVFIDDTSECWTFSNKEVRACKNITYGRIKKEKTEFSLSENLAALRGERINAT